jgi:glutathione S-transferase
VFDLIREVFYKHEPGRHDARIASARDAIADHYTELERGLDGAMYLDGDYSIADIGYFMTVTFAANLGAPLEDAQPRLRAWYECVLARPAVGRELARLLGATQS